MGDDSTGARRRHELKAIYDEAMRKKTGALAAWGPLIVVLVTFAGTVAVNFNRLDGIEKLLSEQAKTMHRLEGALTHMEVLDLRLANLEATSEKHEGKLEEVGYLRAQYEQQKTSLYGLGNRQTEAEIETNTRLSVLEARQ